MTTVVALAVVGESRRWGLEYNIRYDQEDDLAHVVGVSGEDKKYDVVVVEEDEEDEHACHLNSLPCW